MSPTLFQDVFRPLLFSSESLTVSDEQKMYAREVLEICCSDSKFAQKAYDALVYILTVGPTIPPVVTSLVPSSATLGDPSFTLQVLGTGFTPQSLIFWNGAEEPTTFVSAGELTTEVDMSTAEFALELPIMVQNPDGAFSNMMMFSLSNPPLMDADFIAKKKFVEKKEEEDKRKGFVAGKKSDDKNEDKDKERNEVGGNEKRQELKKDDSRR